MKPIHLQKTYLKRPETKGERVFNGDDPKENKAFFTALKADEKERIVSNKQSIEYFEKTLYKYSEILACEVKSKKNARELKELVIDKLRALQVFKSNDEFSKKYNELILFGKSLLSQIETMIIDLPDDKEPYSKIYDGITKNLSKYIEGATDGTIEHIRKHKALPDGVPKPDWIGSKADAHRFRIWCNMTEKPMINCFNELTTDNFYRSSANKDFILEKRGSIYDILKNYPEP